MYRRKYISHFSKKLYQFYRSFSIKFYTTNAQYVSPNSSNFYLIFHSILSFEILQATDIVSVVKNYLKNSRNLHNIFLSSIVKVLLKTQSLDSIKLSADKFSEA